MTAEWGEDEQATLLRRLSASDLSALEVLYDRFGALAYGLALRITADPGLAEDAVQEAFLGVWRHAGSFDAGRGSVRTWLLTIVHHRAIDSVRRRRPVAPLPTSVSDQAPPASLILPDIWPEVSRRLDGAAVRRALASLPEHQREAIELAYFRGLTQQEIAESTQAPLGTVKSRVRLGLQALRRALEAEAGSEEVG